MKRFGEAISGEHQSAALPKLITRAELAEYLRISQRSLIRRLPEVPNLAPVKIGSRFLFSPDEVERIEDHFRCPLSSATSGMRVELSGLGEELKATAVQSQENACHDPGRQLCQGTARALLSHGRYSLGHVAG